MAKARPIDNPYRDMILEMEEAELMKDLYWAPYLRRMGAKGLKNDDLFTATEVAAVLKFATTDQVYALVASGALVGMNKGTGTKRFVQFSRAALKAFIADRRMGY